MSDEPTWADLFAALIARQDLDAERTSWAMDKIMSGEASTGRIAAFLLGLRAKGETVEEVTGLAEQMLAHARRFTVPGRSVDIVGTGGDRAHTVNISTMAALVIAGAGLTVVKHGNRAASSSSGSADVLEALGLDLSRPVERVAQLAGEVGITFCFAGLFHPAMRHAAAARGELGVGTTFNFLGPLTNPAQPQAAAIGVADARMAPLMAGVLARRGTSALVFRGDGDGLDELAATGPSRIWEVRGGEVAESVVDGVTDLGLDPIRVADLRGGDAAANARVALDLLAGAPGPVRQTVLFNAAAGLVADGTLPGLAPGDDAQGDPVQSDPVRSGPVRSDLVRSDLVRSDLVQRLRRGYALAEQALDGGAAADVLERWKAAP